MIQELLGADFVCDQCGRRHRVTVRDVVVSEDAIEHLPDLCRRHGRADVVHLIADTRTYAAAGATAHGELERHGLTVNAVVIPDPAPGHSPVCDDRTRAWIEERLPRPGLFLAVGSGVVNDTTKWIAADREIPYIVLGTAASMNGYPSTNISPVIGGVKALIYGSSPVAILALPSVLAAAPPELAGSGLGDVLPNCVSTSDWLVSSLIFDDVCYCPLCADLIKDVEPVYLVRPAGLPAGDETVMTALFDSLILTGLSMCMAETPAPASGGEHLISHTIDMKAMIEEREHDLHGRQVGIGTIVAAAVYEEVLAIEQPRFRDLGGATDPAYWGRFAGGVESEHVRKRAKAARSVAAFSADPGLWDRVRQAVAPRLHPPARLKECLNRAGGAHCLRDIGVGRERFIEAVLHAHELRDRYTVLDLARAVGVLPERVGDIVDRWVAS